MIVNKLFYANKADPRIFVYKTENKAYGVTFNFAHRKARVLMLLVLALLLVPNVLISICRFKMPIILSVVVYDVILVPALGIFAFRGAASDLKRHPGLNGPRA